MQNPQLGKNHKAGAHQEGTRRSCPQLSLHSMWVLCWVIMYWWRRRRCISAELSSGFTLLWILWSLRSIFTATVLFTWRNQTPLALMCLGCPVCLLHYECLFWMAFQALQGCKVTPQRVGENLGYRKLSLEHIKLNILLKNLPVRRDKIFKGGKITMTFAKEEGCKFPAWKSAFLSLESRIEAK